MAQNKKKRRSNCHTSKKKTSLSKESRNLILSKAIEKANRPASESKRRIYAIFSSYIVSFAATCIAAVSVQGGDPTGYIFFAGAIATLIYSFFKGRKNVNENEYVILSKILMAVSAVAAFLGICMIYYLVTSSSI